MKKIKNYKVLLNSCQLLETSLFIVYPPKRQPDSYQFIGSNRCLNCAVCDANYRIQTVILYAESLAIRLVNFRLLTLYWLSMYVVHLYLLLEVLIIFMLFLL